MKTSYGLFIDRGPVAGRLQLMRWLLEPGSYSIPHLTIRYASSHLPAWMKTLYEETVISSLSLESAGTFDAEGWSKGAVETAFLTSFSSELEALSYKPDFPDSIFHLSVYAGTRSRLAYRALREMSRLDWGLTLPIPAAHVMTFQQYRKSQGGAVATGLIADAEESLYRLTGSNERVETLQHSLSEMARLELLRALCGELHDLADEPRRAPTAVPALFEDAGPEGILLSRPVQGALLSREEVWGSQSDRNELRASGTFITPPEVAREMARCAIGYLPKNEPIDFVDPALGGGILYAQVLRIAREQDRMVRTALGVEKNQARAERARLKFGHEGLQVLASDFLSAAPRDLGDEHEHASYNLLIANPPYLRPRADDTGERVPLQDRLSQRLGIQLRPAANAYVYFVLASIRWLREGAISAWLLPRDALFSASSFPMREYLAGRETILRVHEYPDLNRFQSARVSQILLILARTTPEPEHRVVWTTGEVGDENDRGELVLQEDLLRSPRWSVSRPRAKTQRDIRIGDLFEVRRGIATGANSAFVLDDRFRELVGPHAKDLLKPVLPKSRFLPNSVIEADRHGFPILDRRLWLIDTALPLSQVRALSPWLAGRLEEIQAEFGSRTLLSRRHPFYRQEPQEPPAFVCVAMTRGAADGESRRFFLNLSEARVLNNYHAMYLKKDFEDRCIREGISTLAILRELEGIPKDAYLEAGRWYHSGLVKLEPGDLRELRVGGLLAAISSNCARGGSNE